MAAKRMKPASDDHDDDSDSMDKRQRTSETDEDKKHSRVILMPSLYHDWELRFGLTVFKCHRSFLAKDSEMFRTLLGSEQDGKFTQLADGFANLPVGRASEDALRAFLQLLYNINCDCLTADNVRAVVVIAQYFTHTAIVKSCADYLLSHLQKWRLLPVRSVLSRPAFLSEVTVCVFLLFSNTFVSMF